MAQRKCFYFGLSFLTTIQLQVIFNSVVSVTVDSVVFCVLTPTTICSNSHASTLLNASCFTTSTFISQICCCCQHEHSITTTHLTYIIHTSPGSRTTTSITRHCRTTTCLRHLGKAIESQRVATRSTGRSMARSA